MEGRAVGHNFERDPLREFGSAISEENRLLGVSSLRFLSNVFKKQLRNLCFNPLLFCMNHNDLPTK
jgi:hypothetical protein